MAVPDQAALFKAYRDALPKELSGLLLELKMYSSYEVVRFLLHHRESILAGQERASPAQAARLLLYLRPFLSGPPPIQESAAGLLEAFRAAAPRQARLSREEEKDLLRRARDPAPPAPAVQNERAPQPEREAEEKTVGPAAEAQEVSPWHGYSPDTDDRLFIEAIPTHLARRLLEQKLRRIADILDYINARSEQIRQGEDPLQKKEAVLLLRKMQPFVGRTQSPQKIIRQDLLRALASDGQNDMPPAGPPPPADAPEPPKTRNLPPRGGRAAERMDDAQFSELLKTSSLTTQYKDGCPVCQVVFRLDRLAGHIQDAHALLAVNCRYCGVRLDPGSLARHLLRKHHGEISDMPRVPIASQIEPHMRVTEQTPPAAAGPADPYAFFCRATPAEVLERLQAQRIQDLDGLLALMDERREEICQNAGPFLAGEAVLMLRRLMALGVSDPRVVYLLRDALIALKAEAGSLLKPRRFQCDCPVCGKPFALEWLHRHLQYEHTRIALNCPFCGRKLRAATFVIHVSEQHPTRLSSVFEHPAPLSSPARSEEPQVQSAPTGPQPARSGPPEATAELSPPPARFAQPIPAAHLPVAPVVRSGNLREFRPRDGPRRARKIRLPSDLGDRTYFVSQAARIKTERANRIHESTLAALRAHLEQAGIEVEETFLIDAFAEFDGPNIFEVKSIDSSNEKSQVRHALAQLYEYRFVYGMKDARLWLVLSGKPDSSWILRYLVQDRDIQVLWLADGCLSGLSLEVLEQSLRKDARP